MHPLLIRNYWRQLAQFWTFLSGYFHFFLGIQKSPLTFCSYFFRVLKPGKINGVFRWGNTLVFFIPLNKYRLNLNQYWIWNNLRKYMYVDKYIGTKIITKAMHIQMTTISNKTNFLLQKCYVNVCLPGVDILI